MMILRYQTTPILSTFFYFGVAHPITGNAARSLLVASRHETDKIQKFRKVIKSAFFYALRSALRTLSGVSGGAIHLPIALATAQAIIWVVAIE